MIKKKTSKSSLPLHSHFHRIQSFYLYNLENDDALGLGPQVNILSPSSSSSSSSSQSNKRPIFSYDKIKSTTQTGDKWTGPSTIRYTSRPGSVSTYGEAVTTSEDPNKLFNLLITGKILVLRFLEKRGGGTFAARSITLISPLPRLSEFFLGRLTWSAPKRLKNFHLISCQIYLVPFHFKKVSFP